jgi:hypothetical protein
MHERDRDDRDVHEIYVRDSNSGMSIALAAVLLVVFVVIVLGGIYLLAARTPTEEPQTGGDAGGSIEINLPGGGADNSSADTGTDQTQ